jgi:hypothetical protein
MVNCRVRDVSLGAAAFVGFITSGCATINYTVVRHYAPQVAVKDDASWFNIGVKVSFSPTLQTTPDAVGVKKNGYGWEMAHYFVHPSPQEWIAGNLLAEFRRAGFNVVDEQGGDVVSVTAHVDQLFVEPGLELSAIRVAAIATASVDVVLPGSDRQFSRKFVGMQVTSELFATDAIHEKNLVDAAESCFRQVASGVYELLSTNAEDL